ncbi:MAG: alpha/beta hydrolase-fold protein [Bacteroidia bacterium]
MNKIYFTLLLFCLISLHSIAQDSTRLKQNSPFVLGTTVEIYSSQLGEKRTLNIYFPEGYNPKDTVKYPVIYLLDGSAEEDFIHIAGIVQFLNFPWVNILPKSIVVGIANVDRQRDFTFPTHIEKDKKAFPTTGGSERFIAFIEKELQPYIEKNYKTNSSKTIIGESLGGLLATEILFKKPKLFTNYIIVSPSLWWDNESLFSADSTFLKTKLNVQTSVYVAVGKEGGRMQKDAKKLAHFLRKQRNKNVRVKFHYFINENHATIMHQAVYKAFEYLK